MNPQSFSPCELYDVVPSTSAHVCRRKFLQLSVGAASFAAAHCALMSPSAAAADKTSGHEASFYERLPDNYVRCKLCPRECVVGSGDLGYCHARQNHEGRYYSIVYSRIVAAHVDPIEKKPFFHFLPGALAFSVASGGCNVTCKFCQNWQISQARPTDLEAETYSPASLAENAKANGCKVMAYTYSEPIVFSEYVLDASAAGHREGVRSVMITNGFIQQEPWRQLCGSLDAVKVDLKAFSEKYYRDVVGAELKPVLQSIVAARKNARWLEIVYLVVPTLNDNEKDFRDLAVWMKNEVGRDVPIHFTRFYPLYRLKNLPPTPVETLERAKSILESEGLQYVYIGNIPNHRGSDTYCPNCRRLIIERQGFTVTRVELKVGKCKYCNHPIHGVWSA